MFKPAIHVYALVRQQSDDMMKQLAGAKANKALFLWSDPRPTNLRKKLDRNGCVLQQLADKPLLNQDLLKMSASLSDCVL
jgi:hypothetical protein